MTVSIQKIYNKGSGKLNEDALLIKDKLFAVFDGASNLVKFLNKKGETGGELAAKIAKRTFSKNDKSLKQLANEANSQILENMLKEKVDINQKEALWPTSLAAIRLKNGRVEFFGVGDCFILAVLSNGSHKLLTPYFDHDLGTMIKWEKLAKKRIKNIYDILKPQTDKVRRGANIKYGCLNGEKEAKKFFRYGKISLKNIRSIILFTDGLLIPKKNPKASEKWDFFVKLYRKSGLKEVCQYVRSLEKTDPNCWKYPRFKQHDDMAAIGINF